MWAKTKQFLLRHELLIIILCLVSFMRLPSLLEPYWYGDEGIYLTLGQGVRKGLTLYRDIHDNKPPIIYWMAAVSGSLFWFRFLLLIWNLASIALFHWISTRILNPHRQSPFIKFASLRFPLPTFATLATFLFALLPFVAEGNVANGEMFMLLPVLAGVGLLIKFKEVPRESARALHYAAAAGACYSFAFLIKAPALFDAIPAGIYFFFLDGENKASLKNRLIKFLRAGFSAPHWLYILAFLLPIVVSLGYFGAKGALSPYIRAAFAQNISYLSSWKTGTHQVVDLKQTSIFPRAGLLALASALIVLFNPKLLRFTSFALLWFAFSLFGALLSERPYPHYLIQVIPPLALCLSLFVQDLHGLSQRQNKRRRNQAFTVACLSLCIVALVVGLISIKFWTYSIPPYYQNYWKFVTGKIDRDQYLAYFDASLPELYQISARIVTSSDSSDTIFLWGDVPSVYALTRRLPPGRFVSAYHIKDFGGYDETYAAIVRNSPKYILIDKTQSPFPNLGPLLEEEYSVSYESQRFTLYRVMRSAFFTRK